MTQKWTATIQLSSELARSLVASQFPELKINTFEYLGEGWDNTVYLLNRNTVFRFPRRAFGLECIKDEMKCMPHIGPRLPYPVSYPTHLGQASNAFPYPFAGYPYIEGHPISDLDFKELPKTNLISDLAAFLKALHQMPIDSIPETLPDDSKIRRMDFEYRMPLLEGYLKTLKEGGHLKNSDELLALAKSCERAFSFVETKVITHGDLYSRHILMNGAHLSGVIDWGDFHVNTPAIDLSVIYSLFSKTEHPKFWELYGNVGINVQQQALFRAIFSNVIFLLYAIDIDDTSFIRASEQGLIHCLEHQE